MTKNAAAKKFVFRTTPALVAWPCTISVPLDGGAREDQEVNARFRVVEQEELEQAFPRFAQLTEAKKVAAFMAGVIDGFDGLKDEDGKPVDDATAKATLLSLPYGIDGLVKGYFDFIGRRLEKN